MSIWFSGRACCRLTCDLCDFEPPDVGFETFREAADWAKSHGWKSRKDAKTGEWDNLCPDCARKEGLVPPTQEPLEPPQRAAAKAKWVPLDGEASDLP